MHRRRVGAAAALMLGAAVVFTLAVIVGMFLDGWA